MSTNTAVIVSSDRAHTGTYEDLAGPAARTWLEGKRHTVLSVVVVPDEPEALTAAIDRALHSGVNLIVVSGGTGLSPRDRTPQTLDQYCDYQIPGFGELLRQGSLKYSLNAYLSRCGGWVKQQAIILALPGNPKAVTEQLDILSDVLPHALMSVKGECKHRRKTGDNA